MNECCDALRSIFCRNRRTKTSTVRSRWVSRRPQTFWRSSSRVTTRPRSRASVYSSLNSVGVSSALLPSTNACTSLRVDPQLLDLDRLAAPLLLRPDAAARGGADPRHELAHRERLHEVVVGADLERVHAVVLGPARGDDHDRRADPLRARRLDQLPPVELGQHQVEHADVGVLEPEPGEPELAAADDDRVESRRRQVLGHPVRDHIVVLDDQDLGHAPYDSRGVGFVRVSEW